MHIARIAAIVNPVSGVGLDPYAASARVAMLRDALTRRQLSATIDVTARAGHARDLARAAVASRADLVIVWGGDGTVNEVGSELAGSPTALGLIPAGSGNGLAGGLGVPRDPHAALATALGERTLAVDVGMLDDHPFFNIAGIGFDAHIARLFNQRPRGRRGRVPYVVIGVREGCRYAGRDRSVLARFRDARHLALGSVHRAPRMVIQPVRTAMVETAGEIEYHLDGEPGIARDRVTVTIRPRALMVKV